MALAHFGPHLWIIRPIARYLYTSCLGVPECARDISRCYRMQMHLVAGQADAIVDEIAAVDRTKGRLGGDIAAFNATVTKAGSDALDTAGSTRASHQEPKRGNRSRI